MSLPVKHFSQLDFPACCCQPPFRWPFPPGFDLFLPFPLAFFLYIGVRLVQPSLKSKGPRPTTLHHSTFWQQVGRQHAAETASKTSRALLPPAASKRAMLSQKQCGFNWYFADKQPQGIGANKKGRSSIGPERCGCRAKRIPKTAPHVFVENY